MKSNFILQIHVFLLQQSPVRARQDWGVNHVIQHSGDPTGTLLEKKLQHLLSINIKLSLNLLYFLHIYYTDNLNVIRSWKITEIEK